MRPLMQSYVLVVTLGCLLTSAVGSSAESLPWRTSIAEAFEQAKAENRPLLLHFWTPECLPCRQLERNVFNQPRVVESLTQQFIPVKINAHEHSRLATQYGIRSVPKDVIVTPDNEEIHRMFTPKDPEQYIAQLSAVAFRANRDGMTDSELVSTDRQDRFELGANLDRKNETPRDTSRMARRSPLASPVAQTTDLTPTEPNDDLGPREIINRFAGKMGRNTARSDSNSTPSQSARAEQRPSGGSRWGSWPNDAKSNSGSELPESRSDTSAAETRSAPGREDRTNNATAVAAQNRTKTRPGREARRPADAPPIAMDGYCPVTLLRDNGWVKGDKRYGVVHRGRTYLFVSEKEKKAFFADPDEYSPVLAGIDLVALNQKGSPVEGKRVHGVVYHGRVYLFASEDNLNRFWEDPERYAAPIRQALKDGDLNRLFR